MHTAIIGGGASGLMAALTALDNGHTVTLFERQARVGKKLSATGNGRCNLSNEVLTVKNYHGADPDFASYAIDSFTVSDTVDYFRTLGLITVTEPGGRIYPLSDQAGSVVDVLRLAAAEKGAEMISGTEVTQIRLKGAGFTVITDGETRFADKVIVCCGGMAGGKLGGTKSGYELLKSFGHSCTKLFPSLVQLKTDTTFVRSLKGVRADAAVTLTADGSTVAESAGEVQFTDYGVSGPAIFEISRSASTARGALCVSLDLMRGHSESEVCALISDRAEKMPSITLENLLTGMLHNRLGRTVIRYAGFDLNAPVTSLSAKDIRKIAHAAKYFSLDVSGNMGFDAAQVTAGGIRTDEFDPKTLESRIVPGLYAAGEVLDIDGDCGGYNLQWAWSSGHLAGQLL